MKVINLLPALRQKDLRFQRWFAALRRLLIIVAVSILIVVAGQMSAFLYLRYEKGILDDRIEQLQSVSKQKENAEVKQEIQSINDTISDFKLLAGQTPHWSKVIIAFANLVPPGVKINSLVTDLATKKITIQGYSTTREQVILLYTNIKTAEKDFFDIDYPLENVSKAVDVPFHFTFSVREELFQ
jgi:Tfp pilus assembly protein PilN